MMKLPFASLLFLLLTSKPVYCRRGPYGTCVKGVDCTPPMGWRTWNAFLGNVNQSLMMTVIDKMVEKKYSTYDSTTNNAESSSLLSFYDLGYTDCGLDDNWQSCGKGINGSFHNVHGHPLVNYERFPNFKQVTDYAKTKDITVGFYLNNCICSENSKNTPKFQVTNTTQPSLDDIYDSEALDTIITYGFSSVKLDGCGQFRNLDWYYDKFEKYTTQANKPGLLVENCHWGGTVPTKDWCPWSYFRSSSDIRANWDSMFRNLQTVVRYSNISSKYPLSRPGCWSYPDMMQVGRMPGGIVEDRSHFGSWCVTSSPLILGHDITNITLNKLIWPIISNKEAINVNQVWFGHPGTLVYTSYVTSTSTDDTTTTTSSSTVTMKTMASSSKKNKIRNLRAGDNNNNNEPMEWEDIFKEKDGNIDNKNNIFFNNGKTIAYQIWAKPITAKSTALLYVSNNGIGSKPQRVTGISVIGGQKFNVRCIWGHKDIGNYTTKFQPYDLNGHDSHFYIITLIEDDDGNNKDNNNGKADNSTTKTQDGNLFIDKHKYHHGNSSNALWFNFKFHDDDDDDKDILKNDKFVVEREIF